MKLQAIIIVGAIIAFMAIIAAFLVLTLAGKDTSIFVGFVTSAAVFLVPQLINILKTHSTEQTVNQMQSDVQEVKQRTNGPLAHMQGQIDDLARYIKKDGNDAGST